MEKQFCVYARQRDYEKFWENFREIEKWKKYQFVVTKKMQQEKKID